MEDLECLVGNALRVLNAGLQPYVERELRARYADRWLDAAEKALRENRVAVRKAAGGVHWDTQSLLAVMLNQWNVVFTRLLGRDERTLVNKLRSVRDKWAHQEDFTPDSAFTALHDIESLLVAVAAEDRAQQVRQLRRELAPRLSQQAAPQDTSELPS